MVSNNKICRIVSIAKGRTCQLHKTAGRFYPLRGTKKRNLYGQQAIRQHGDQIVDAPMRIESNNTQAQQDLAEGDGMEVLWYLKNVDT